VEKRFVECYLQPERGDHRETPTRLSGTADETGQRDALSDSMRLLLIMPIV
jgi:hypothetical protein